MGRSEQFIQLGAVVGEMEEAQEKIQDSQKRIFSLQEEEAKLYIALGIVDRDESVFVANPYADKGPPAQEVKE